MSRSSPSLQDATAIVGVGESAFHHRARSHPRTRFELGCDAIVAAVEDAGLSLDDVDGLTCYTDMNQLDPAAVTQFLGIPRLRYAAAVPGGGGGSAAAIGLAATAIHAGVAEVVVTVHAVQFASGSGAGHFKTDARRTTSWHDFVRTAGLVSPGQMFAMLAQRHMYEHGTTREHFAEVALSSRANALQMPFSLAREPLTLEQYLAAPMIAEPFGLLDFCRQADGAAACVTTTATRALDLRHRPAYVHAVAMGGEGRWGEGEEWLQLPDDQFATAGLGPIARSLFDAADVGPDRVDVAELYDHFTGMVLLQLEDLGFCERGGAGDFVEREGIRWPHGRLPVNTHGGSLSHMNLNGMTHVNEAVRQIQGRAVNQVAGAGVALVTGAPGKLPLSALLLRR